MLTGSPNYTQLAIIVGFWLMVVGYRVVKPRLIIADHNISRIKQGILQISYLIITVSTIGWTLHLARVTPGLSQPKDIIIVVDQSRSMTADDLTPSRRGVAQQIITQIATLPNHLQLIGYAQTPIIYSSGSNINSLSPITDTNGSSALGDARLIAYDTITYNQPIVITITDGGVNTGFDLTQTAQILHELASLWIIGISTGTRIVAYDEQGRGLTSTMNTSLLESLADTGHRYPIPDDESVSEKINLLLKDLGQEYYTNGESRYSLQNIRLTVFAIGMIGLVMLYYNTSYSTNK